MRDYHLNFVVVAESIDEAVYILDETSYENKLQYITENYKESSKDNDELLTTMAIMKSNLERQQAQIELMWELIDEGKNPDEISISVDKWHKSQEEE